MASLLSASKQLAINNIFVNLHDTFSREIIVYKNAKKSVSTSSSQYNGIYGNAGKTTSVINTEVSRAIQARVYYTNLKEEILSESDAPASKVILPQGPVKIIVDSASVEFVREARRVEFDGKIFSIISEWTPICLFDNLYYEFYLNPIDA